MFPSCEVLYLFSWFLTLLSYQPSLICILKCFSYNNKKKMVWNLLFLILLGLLLMRLVHQSFCYIVMNTSFFFCTQSLSCSLAGTITSFMASYWNYPSGHALKELHGIGEYMSPEISMHWLQSILLEFSLRETAPCLSHNLVKYWSCCFYFS